VKPLTTDERLLVNKAFWAVLIRRFPFDAYWIDSIRQVSVRRVAGRRNLAPPNGAVHFGRYDGATNWPDFIADLESTLNHREAA